MIRIIIYCNVHLYIMIDQLFTAIMSAGKWLICDQQRLLEFSLVIGSIFSHFLDARQNIWSKILAFPLSFISIYIYSVRQLFGKVINSIIFICFNLYAYLRWKGTIGRKPVEVSRTSYKVLSPVIGMRILGGIARIFILGKYFDISPCISVYGDAYYFVFGLMHKWRMSHKGLERWMVSLFRYIVFFSGLLLQGSDHAEYELFYSIMYMCLWSNKMVFIL